MKTARVNGVESSLDVQNRQNGYLTLGPCSVNIVSDGEGEVSSGASGQGTILLLTKEAVCYAQEAKAFENHPLKTLSWD